MAMKVRQEFMGVDTRINTQEIHRVSQMVSQLCNMPIQPNKAIVGSNAFAHSSGIHQDGMLKTKIPTKSCHQKLSVGRKRN